MFRSTDIIGTHRTVVAGIPVTTVDRTLVDLGAVARDWEVQEGVDRAIARGLTSVAELERMLDQVARRGRRGVGPLRRALVDIVDGVESVLEAKLVRLILRSTLPRPVLQHRVPLGPGDVARIDAAYPDIKLAIEADGRGAHITRSQFDRDRERQQALEAMGWRILRFTWTHVTQREAWVVQTIREAHAQRSVRPRS